MSKEKDVRRFKVPVCEMDIDLNTGVIWVNSPLGATVLRIKCWHGIKVTRCSDNPVTHFDLNVLEKPVNICLGPDAEQN